MAFANPLDSERSLMAASKYAVPWQELCWRCSTDDLSFESTAELAPLQGFVGQERALKAIRFGLEVDKPGYNLFVTGLTGTGRASVIKSHLQSIIEDRATREMPSILYDWCYLHNFADGDRPQVLKLAAGKGKRLQQALDGLLKTLREQIPKAFGADEYTAERNQLEETGRESYQRTLQELERELKAEHFGLQLSPVEANLFPLDPDGRPMSPEQFMRLGDSERAALDEKRDRLLEIVQETMEQLRGIEHETREKLHALDRRVGELTLSRIYGELLAAWTDVPEVAAYLAALKDYTLNNLPLFLREGAPAQAALPLGLPGAEAPQRSPFLPFEVNIIVDNEATKAAPIVIESNPTWANLFGRIERHAYMGAYFSDHTMLRAGSMHQANGGYLVLNAKDTLINPGVWDGLKRAIRDREVRLEDPAVQYGLVPPQGLRPNPIPWNAKVIVAGDETIYRLLSTYDQDDFWEMFKVKAEFDSQIELNQENVSNYSAFVRTTAEAEGLLPFDRTGVARVVEYGARMVADQHRLSTRFGQIKDVLIEADYWARRDASQLVTGDHVKKALEEKLYRLNLTEEKLRQLIAEGTLMVDVVGEVVGQVNGLVVYDLGDFSFGRPARITARTYAGRRGLINIEREAQLSGRIHDKGVLILSGYLGWKFAQNQPLALTASLSFEQSYEGVEGDSASSTELYAILSSLAELPLRQDIAVTGSVNQKGEIQPIGGVNQKVEGFFDLCRLHGLTGNQGVIVPSQNLRNLMLHDDVVEAVREGQFHIYAVKTIDEGSEVLTGVPAGEPAADGSFPEGTVNYLVRKRLAELAGSLRGFYAEVLGGAE